MSEGVHAVTAAPSGETRRCSRCKEMKSVHEFYRGRSLRLRYECKECCKAAARTFVREHPDRIRAYKRASRVREYGIEPAEYDAMFVLQGGACALCHEPPAAGEALVIDHDHATGAVRGLLHSGCNLHLTWHERHGAQASAYLARATDAWWRRLEVADGREQ